MRFCLISSRCKTAFSGASELKTATAEKSALIKPCKYASTYRTILPVSSPVSISRSIRDNAFNVLNCAPNCTVILLNDVASSPNSSALMTSTSVAKSRLPSLRVPSISFSSGTKTRLICIMLNNRMTSTERMTLPQNMVLKRAILPSASTSGWIATTSQRGVRNCGSRNISW